MATSLAQQRVGDLVRQQISRARVFERFGIDYCCGGQKLLADACAEQKLDIDHVVRELNESDFFVTRLDDVDWSSAPLCDLIDHIISKHHEYLRRELPRLDQLMAQVASVHGLKHCQLHELARVFVELETELREHMLNEEEELFPIIKQLEQATSSSPVTQDVQCGSVCTPIGILEVEHRDVAMALVRMRELTNDYVDPPDACATYRAMLDGLDELETDLHLHIHKENNILFPRAAQLEESFDAAYVSELGS